MIDKTSRIDQSDALIMYNDKANPPKSHNLIFVLIFLLTTVASSIVGSMVLAPSLFLLLHVLLIFVLLTTLFILEEKFEIKDSSNSVIIIILFSAFQSLIIGYFVPAIDENNVKIITGTSFLLPVIYLFILAKKSPFYLRRKEVRTIFFIALFIFSYSIFSWIIFRAPVISAVSSLRNIMAPFLFTLLGIFISNNCDKDHFIKLICIIGMIVIFIGLLERFIIPNFWDIFNVNELYAKKGIMKLARYMQYPSTWYSSEAIGGAIHTRRMVSSFADPVNLGAFLFFLFISAFLRNNRTLLILSVVSILLTISKGGVASLLVFLSIFFYFRNQKAWPFILMLNLAVAFLLFLYIKQNSTGSMMAHIQGLTSAVSQLPKNPFGHGLGNIGILQNLFRVDQVENIISESGIGVIIGQLGIFGFVCYLFFFKTLIDIRNRLKDNKIKLAYLAIIAGIGVNILFNEVALSPNSCAPYFIYIGLVYGSCLSETKSPRGYTI